MLTYRKFWYIYYMTITSKRKNIRNFPKKGSEFSELVLFNTSKRSHYTLNSKDAKWFDDFLKVIEADEVFLGDKINFSMFIKIVKKNFETPEKFWYELKLAMLRNLEETKKNKSNN